jgi:hypothetical protein
MFGTMASTFSTSTKAEGALEREGALVREGVLMAKGALEGE